MTGLHGTHTTRKDAFETHISYVHVTKKRSSVCGPVGFFGLPLLRASSRSLSFLKALKAEAEPEFYCSTERDVSMNITMIQVLYSTSSQVSIFFTCANASLARS